MSSKGLKLYPFREMENAGVWNKTSKYFWDVPDGSIESLPLLCFTRTAALFGKESTLWYWRVVSVLISGFTMNIESRATQKFPEKKHID
jgi:hypothetical protein